MVQRVFTGSWDEAVLVGGEAVWQSDLRVMTKPLFDFKAKEGSKADVFHDVVTILKPFSCPCYETTTGGCWLLLDLLLVHKQVAEKSLLIQRWG